MLNTKKLLYILPDVTYIAELLPTKKEHTFSIHSFRQINGEFLNDDDFIAENIEKLFSKIDADEYHLILPDFLFTNTVLEVQDTAEAKVRTYLKEKLLPSLNLSKDTHFFETTILNQYGGKSKVQLSALEKSVLNPIVVSTQAHDIKIAAVSPLSWSIKSVISLEPSISVVQIGSLLYVAQHYIGVDQTIMANVDEIENVGETIKTLKGAEPSIQTVYLLTNSLVEEKLKGMVSSTLPIQQLATFKEDDTQMPSYVRYIIESAMKTLDITEYPVPRFELPTEPVAVTESSEEAEEKEDSTEEVAKPALPVVAPVLPAVLVIPLPEPTNNVSAMTAEPVKAIAVDLDEDDDESEDELDAELIESLIEPEEDDTDSESALPLPTATAGITSPALAAQVGSSIAAEEVEKSVSPMASSESLDDAEPDLSQFARHKELESEASEEIVTPVATPVPRPTPPSKPTPQVIKNKSGTGSMMKMIGVTVGVFLLTVIVGVSIGYGILKFTEQEAEQPLASATPLASIEATATPVPSPTPTASSSATVAAETSVLVVNATTKAGYAGSTRSKLEAAGYKLVRAANAKGTYDDGTYVLLKTRDEALISQLEAATDLELTYADGFSIEDARGEYDAVIVLAE
ncbi:MAG: LytR C-terminal domain-containing protein [bacterium]|nr:LytR C-terminal domain-containing protein [bacterium]